MKGEVVRRGREIALEILDRREDLQSPGARDVRRNLEELLRQSLAATRTAVVDLVEPQGAPPAELEEHERLHVFRALKLALGHEPIDGPLELRRNRRGSRAVAPKTLSEDVQPRQLSAGERRDDTLVGRRDLAQVAQLALVREHLESVRPPELTAVRRAQRALAEGEVGVLRRGDVQR